MQANLITEENIVYFFNKYKYNSEQIFHLERRLLTESYDYSKWEEMLAANSKLTRSLFVENEELINEYIRPAIKNPELLSPQAVHTYLLHITFYLFENHIDSHVTDDLVESILQKCTNMPPVDRFEALMNLGISKTVTMYDTYENTKSYFDMAMQIYPDFSAAPNDDIRIHLVFCRTFELLCMDLFKAADYAEFTRIQEEIEKMVLGGNAELYGKMWGKESDFTFHINLLFRFFRIYGIYLAGVCNFSLDGAKNSDKQKKALKKIISWLNEEYKKETEEGSINPMIYTFFHKQRYISKEIDKAEYLSLLNSVFIKLKEQESFIFPESPFPIDDDPVDPQFSKMLDRMKLFNWSFSYVNVLIPELFRISDTKELKKNLTGEILRYYESGVYAEKGFQTDVFVFENVRLVAHYLDNIGDFVSFVQTIFVHREITSAIHFSMVGTLAGICLSHFIEFHPELFVTDEFKTADDVLKNRTEILQFIRHAGFLHDIGKISRTNLINLHFRKITDFEFKKISEHTTVGTEVIKGIDYLQKFHDIIIGHHKYFDGIHGYPLNVDISKSKYKVFTDLISICDSIDTSTDYQGRNYSKCKSFDDILTELKEMKTRYSPILVQIIDEDEALKDELRYMTRTGRNYTSYDTYRKFVQPNTVFSEDDVKEISIYNNTYKRELFNFYKETYSSYNDDKINEHISELLYIEQKEIFVLHNKKDKIFGLLAGKYLSEQEKEADAFLIRDIIILPELRRKGWGTELLKYAESALKEKNITKLKINIPGDFNMESFFWIEGFTKRDNIMQKDL